MARNAIETDFRSSKMAGAAILQKQIPLFPTFPQFSLFFTTFPYFSPPFAAFSHIKPLNHIKPLSHIQPLRHKTT